MGWLLGRRVPLADGRRAEAGRGAGGIEARGGDAQRRGGGALGDDAAKEAHAVDRRARGVRPAARQRALGSCGAAGGRRTPARASQGCRLRAAALHTASARRRMQRSARLRGRLAVVGGAAAAVGGEEHLPEDQPPRLAGAAREGATCAVASGPAGGAGRVGARGVARQGAGATAAAFP